MAESLQHLGHAVFCCSGVLCVEQPALLLANFDGKTSVQDRLSKNLRVLLGGESAHIA
jgi:hypothetical protein